MNTTDLLRSLPSVDEVLRSSELGNLRNRHSHGQLTPWIRDAIARCREQILLGEHLNAGSLLDAVVEIVENLGRSDDGQKIRRVINATGIILHTNLGRSPLADRVVERMNEAARYSNVELNLESGRRNQRGERVVELLAQLTGAEAALVVNNCAAATMLVLQAIATGREVIVSRGQLVEIGGGFRLPDVFRALLAVLKEVGTTNRTYLHDYESAINDQTGAIIRVHRSNFLQSGFVTEPSIDEMVAIQRSAAIPVIDDLGSGCMNELSLPDSDEPTVLGSVKSGADLTLFSGDKLFGGPQAGIIVGRQHWIDVLSKSPMMRAVRVDKMTLAGLEATVEIHLAGASADELPTHRMLQTQPDAIRVACETVKQRVADLRSVDVIACDAQVGGGSVPGVSLPSFAVKIAGSHPDQLARHLRLGTPAVQARVTDDSVMLDLRTVAADELETLIVRLRDALVALADSN